jgi:hypothetical protein
MAEGLAGEARLKVGQPHIVGPGVGGDRDRVRAAVIGTVDQYPAETGLPHFAERDFLWMLHVAMVADQGKVATSSD